MREYFTKKEQSCNCCGEGLLDGDFLLLLNCARHIAGIPFIITSACRCIPHNIKSGGVANSSHIIRKGVGLAVDIKCKTGASRFKIMKALLAVGLSRIGVANGFIHVDMDSAKSQEVIWTY